MCHRNPEPVKDASGIVPAQVAFDSIRTLLIWSVYCGWDYAECWLGCAGICRALDRGTNGKKLDNPNQPLCETVSQSTAGETSYVQFKHLTDDVPAAELWRTSKGGHQTGRLECNLSTSPCEELDFKEMIETRGLAARRSLFLCWRFIAPSCKDI